ncbi:YfhO family protein [Candidatus Shapirobacteria bacterium]|nr:YfhO family protein [Candidatus Shapirobacteria bacterium]
MNCLKSPKSLFNKEIFWFLLILLICLPAGLNILQPGYFSMHDDVQVMRLFQMEKCLRDGQIPCRLVSDMGAGYGHPLYNYHPVFAYYLGMVFRLFGASLMDVSKILFFLTYFLSALFIYYLIREFFGRTSGIVGSVFFLYAPYHAVDVYVRGAMTESWGIVFFPLIFLSLYKFIKESGPKWFILSILSLTGLFLSHNIMTLLFAPISLAWAIYWLIVLKRWKDLRLPLAVLLIFLWAGGLAAFFLIPAFFEQSLVKIDSLISDYYNFRYHFTTVRQLLIDRSFGYGPSRPGPIDGLSFQLGWPHWPVALFGGLTGLWLLIRRRSAPVLAMLFLFCYWLGAVAMTHSKSSFIWERLSILSFVQFPWRFLGIAMFAGAFLAGGTISFLEKKLLWPVSALLIALVVMLNLGYFRPEKHFYDASDQKILSGESWKTQSMATLLDYIPSQVKEYPIDLAPANPWSTSGEARITEFRRRSDFWRFTIVASSDQAVVTVPVFDFPKWQVLIDQNSVSHTSDNALGLISVEVPKGNHTVVGWFENTRLRLIANALTIFSFLILILYVVYVDEKSKRVA